MRISEFIPQSLIDYPDKICSIIFTSPCNLKCGYCHNPSLVKENPKNIPEENILSLLNTQKEFIDAVTITGGEPTLHNDLKDFIKKIKDLNIYVKLDTNGTNPKIIEELLKENLINYIAMDIKAPLSMYEKVVNTKINLEDIKLSIDIIKNSSILYEFRTTVVPIIIKSKQIEEISQCIANAKLYVLQQYHNIVVLDSKFKFIEPYEKNILEDFKKIAEKYIKKVEIRP